MANQIECPLCNSMSNSYPNYDKNLVFFDCPVCGRYELGVYGYGRENLNINKTASYVFYKRILSNTFPPDYRYHTFRTKEECDKYNEAFNNGENIEGRPVHMNNDFINAWYPKTFSERVDYIIKYLSTHIEHIGQQKTFSIPKCLVCFLLIEKNL